MDLFDCMPHFVDDNDKDTAEALNETETERINFELEITLIGIGDRQSYMSHQRIMYLS